MALWKIALGPAGSRALLPLLGLLAAACGGQYPQSTLFPKGSFAVLVDDLFMTTVRWAVVVFVLVEGALLYAVWRFRRRTGGREPEQTHGNALVEIVWTLIPAAILGVIAVPTVRTIFETAERPGGALEIEVIGHQWWWEFRYPDQRIVTANEMHVPTGRTVLLKIRTADVLHSFWVPQLAAKRDAFHHRYTTLWFATDSLGEYPGSCAEFCGTQHARMGSLVVVQTPEDFEAWVEQQRIGSPLIEPAATPDTVPPDVPQSMEQRGREAFLAGGCVGCHAMVGLPTARALNLPGPNLSHFGSRRRLAAGVLANTPENLARWLRDPQAVKPGSLMRLPHPLTEAQIDALVAYLMAHQ